MRHVEERMGAMVTALTALAVVALCPRAVAAGGLKQIAAVRTGQTPREEGEHADKGRIVGRLADCPGCTIEARDDTGKVVGYTAVEPEGKSYAIAWLDPGTYSLRVAADGYEPFLAVGLVLKAGHDVHCDVRFGGVAADRPAQSSKQLKALPPWQLKEVRDGPRPRSFKPKSFKKVDRDFKVANPKRKGGHRGKAGQRRVRKRNRRARGKAKPRRSDQPKGKKKARKKRRAEAATHPRLAWVERCCRVARPCALRRQWRGLSRQGVL